MSDIKINESADQKRFGPVRRSVKVRGDATTPWNLGNTNPWARDMMKLTKKRPGFRAKWVSPEKIEKSRMHGYEICSPEHYGGQEKILGEPTKMAGRIVRRSLTLMEISEKSYQERKAFIAEKNRRAERSYRGELDKAAAQAGRELGEKKSLVTDETRKG